MTKSSPLDLTHQDDDAKERWKKVREGIQQ